MKYQKDIDIENGWKICTQCLKNKDIIHFRFREKKNCYCSKCRQCSNESERTKDSLKPKTIKPPILIEINNEIHKKCPQCNEIKNINSFYITTNTKTGFSSYCRQCDLKRMKIYRDNNKHIGIKYRTEHKEELKQYRRSERAIESRRRRQKEHYHENKEFHSLKAKRLRQTDKFKQNRKKYIKNRLKNDLNFRIKHNIGALIRKSFVGEVKKSIKTRELLGCNIQEFRKYIESTFSLGMDWTNYGKNGWEIDHIIPVRAFNLKDSEQQKKCFHFTNQRALWAEDNNKKNDFLHDGTRARDINF